MSENNRKDYFTLEIEKSKQREAFYNAIVHELQTEERYQHYFQQFSPGSVKQFIDYYARQKVQWYEYSSIFALHAKTQSSYYHNAAVELLRSIQKKKAFNAIIKWGFYELKVPDIKSYFSLQQWLSLPFSSSYITPIQSHEVDTIISFIQSLPEEEKLKYHSDIYLHVFRLSMLGDYELDEEDYPLLCRHYDTVYGLSGIMDTLPPRIAKENEYADAWKEHQKQQAPATEDNKAANQPYLSPYDDKLTDKLMEKYESAHFNTLSEAQKRFNAKSDFYWLPEGELEFLLEARQPVPVNANADWRDGLGNASEMYKRRRIIEELPLVYKEYLQKLNAGSDFLDWQTDKHASFMMPEWYEKRLTDILEGRKLLGEPADFNF